MNQPRLTLTLPPTLGSNKIEIDSRRFSIGRTPENDLPIADSSLSRRHALIENFEGRFNLSDCGSSNGTFINGKPVTGASELSDWDVLTFGGIGDILVRIEGDEATDGESRQVSGVSASRNAAGGEPAQLHSALAPMPSNQSWLTGPVIAAASAGLIILITVIALLIGSNANSRGGSKPIVTRKQTPVVDNDNDDSTRPQNDNASSANINETTPTNPGDGESNELSLIETYAGRVMGSISKDTRLALTQKPLAEISSQVQRYKGTAAFRDQLQAMKRALPQVLATAKSSGIRPALAVYASLAEIDKSGGRGDPAQTAAGVCQSLSRTRAMFGSEEVANDALLWVASLEEGGALQAKITKFSGRVNDSPATIRSVWYLHDHQVISDDTYNLVLRFLAIGVIAQNPPKFGIASDPLTF